VLFSDQVSKLSVASLDEVDRVALLGFPVAMSQDAELCAATYLPPFLTTERATAWLSERGDSAWVLLDDGVPVGWWELAPVKSSCGFAAPPGTFEREVWLAGSARGRRLVQEATRLLRPLLLDRGVRYVLGVTWEDNFSAVKALANAGFDRLGRGWWEWEGELPGWCEVWLLDLAGAALLPRP